MRFDYVIVGGGSAGCVLANRLSEDPDVSVCLVEAGGPDSSPLIHMPAGIAAIVPTRHVNWALPTSPQAGLNDRIGYQPRGKTLGGSSSINAMIYTRGHPEDYDDWARLGNHGWSYRDVLPHFKRTQDQLRGADDYHGSGGELTVADYPSPHPLNQPFFEAAKALGYPANDDFNGASQEGIGLYQTTIRDGQRCSAARAFLTPVLERPNLTVLTRAHTLRVLLDNQRAVGIEIRHQRQHKRISANREVILSAGAFGSPQLLMLSGIGPAGELSRHGIPVQLNLPGVGENLRDHPDYVLSYRSDSPQTIGYSLRGAACIGKGIYQYAQQRRGLLASNLVEAGGFLKTDPALTRPDIQLHYIAGVLDNHNRTLHWGHGFSCHVCVLRPKSVGRVTLASADPLALPVIDPNFLAEPEDLAVLRQGFKMTRELLEHPSFDAIRGQEYYTANARSDADIDHWLRRRTDSIYHPVGTCKMGHDPMAVVDNELKVHGITGLRVVDASIMPTLIGGNTNAPTIMIADKIAESILSTS